MNSGEEEVRSKKPWRLKEDTYPACKRPEQKTRNSSSVAAKQRMCNI